MGLISPGASSSFGTGTSNIIDIRSDSAGIELKQDIVRGLHPENGESKTLPTLLLYDEDGLRLFEEITYLDEYYLTNQEIWMLQRYADRIAERIPNHALIVELGSGNLRKVKILLDALEKAEKEVSYFALDLMQSELERTLAAVPPGTFEHVECAGLWGTYDDGLMWLKRPENAARPKAILSLGSSIGNFTPEEAVPFISQFAKELENTDIMLIALDGCQDPEKVYHAYNDQGDVTHNFTMNGLKHANKLLGHEAFNLSEWEAVGEYDREGSRHRAFVVPKTDLTVEGAFIKKGEKIQIEESNKIPPDEANRWWRNVGALAKESRRGSVMEGERVADLSALTSCAFSNEQGSYCRFLLYFPKSQMISTSLESLQPDHQRSFIAETY